MNFLSHYFLDRDHVSEYFKAGTILPDLMRVPNPAVKLQHVHPDPEMAEESSLVSQGIKRHFLGDKLFHNHPYFTKHSSSLLHIFLENGFDRQKYRLSFLSHILVEMLLDRILLSEEDQVGEDFYKDLAQIDSAYIDRLLHVHPRYDAPAFSKHLRRFLESRYLLAYSETAAIFYAINRISGRLGLNTIDQDDFRAFERAIVQVQEQMLPDYKATFNLISAQIEKS